jgi:uncharacterized protein (DUF433 family)
MTSELVPNPDLGPEIVGKRLTVYHLLNSFFDPAVTEDEICRAYDLTAQQVAAARAYVFRNADTVLAQHLKIEERLAVGNPPEVREQASRAKERLQRFKRWLVEHQEEEQRFREANPNTGQFPSFREWLAERGGR